MLADAAAGRGDAERLTWLLAHFWENRQRARDTFGRLGDKVARLLADMIEPRLGEGEFLIPRRLASLQLAEAALAPIRGWVTGTAPCRPEALAEAICRGGERLAGALSGPAGD